MENENLKIRTIEVKKKESGEKFWRVQTDKGWMTCFEPQVVEVLREHEPDGEVRCKVARTERDGKEFVNIRGIVNENEDVETKSEEKESDKNGKNGDKRSFYVSYAKDIFITICSDYAESEDAMTEAIQLVKQARKAF